MAVAISAISAAAAAIGTEAFIGLAATAAADSGLALTVIGAVTGSRDLMKAGAALGVAGGVVGLASSAFGSAAGAAASAGDATAGSLAGEGAANAVQGDSINALEAQTARDATSGLTSAGSAAPDQASILYETQSPYVAAETGQATGGSPALSGAGGNADAAANSVQGNSVNALDKGFNYGGIIDGTRSSSIIDSVKDLWGGLSNDQKTTVLRAALAIPGGIQAQRTKAREIALQQQKVQQTSFGNSTPWFTLPNQATRTT